MDDVYKIAIFKHLVSKVNISRNEAAYAIKTIHERFDDNFIVLLKPENNDIYDFCDFETLEKMPDLFMAGGWDFLIVIPWYKIKKKVNLALP